MRITFVIPPPDLTGGQRVVSIYAERLRRRGHDVTVVALAPEAPSLRDFARALVKKRQWLSRPKLGPSHFDGLQVPVRQLTHAGPVTDRDVPDGDVVVATWWETAQWVFTLSGDKGAKVHFMQDYEIWGGNVPAVDATCRLPLPKIVIAGWVRDLLRDQFDRGILALIPNSVDAEKFHAPPRGKQPVPTVGVTYSTFLNKGCDLSLKAFSLAKAQLPELKLVAFGNQKLSPELPLPADTVYRFQAPDHELKSIYASCDAWLFGTRKEGFGLPILEAMACRTPVIGTPAGAAPELLAKGGGMLVPHENPAALAEAIVNIARMPEPEWRAISDQALATATGYTWDEATTRFEAALVQAREAIV